LPSPDNGLPVDPLFAGMYNSNVLFHKRVAAYRKQMEKVEKLKKTSYAIDETANGPQILPSNAGVPTDWISYNPFPDRKHDKWYYVANDLMGNSYLPSSIEPDNAPHLKVVQDIMSSLMINSLFLKTGAKIGQGLSLLKKSKGLNRFISSLPAGAHKVFNAGLKTTPDIASGSINALNYGIFNDNPSAVGYMTNFLSGYSMSKIGTKIGMSQRITSGEKFLYGGGIGFFTDLSAQGIENVYNDKETTNIDYIRSLSNIIGVGTTTGLTPALSQFKYKPKYSKGFGWKYVQDGLPSLMIGNSIDMTGGAIGYCWNESKKNKNKDGGAGNGE